MLALLFYKYEKFKKLLKTYRMDTFQIHVGPNNHDNLSSMNMNDICIQILKNCFQKFSLQECRMDEGDESDNERMDEDSEESELGNNFLAFTSNAIL